MFRFAKAIAVCVAIGFGAIAGTAHAGSIDFTNPAFAPIGDLTSIPVGASEFCKANPGDCGANPAPVAAATLTDSRWQQLVDVNNIVNAAIAPVTDEAYYHVAEYWTYPDAYGDCEDFALAKRKALIDAGWNASTLLIAVVRETSGAGHAVLIARTDRGDLVLDNQSGRILVWNDTPYQYLKRQSQTDAGKWVDILDNRTTIVAQR